MKILVPPNPIQLRQPWSTEKTTVVGFTVGRTPRKLKSTDKNTQDILQELTENIPGLEQVLNSEKGFLFNFFWLLLLLSCFLICLYQISDRCRYFLSNPIGNRVTISRNVSVKFPMMTICASRERYTELIHYKYHIAKKYNKNVCQVKAFEVTEFLNISTVWDKMNLAGQIKYAGVFTRLVYSTWVIPPVKNKTTTTIFGTCTTFLEENLVLYRGLDYVITVTLLDNTSLTCKKDDNSALYTIHTNEDITYKLSTLYERLMYKIKISYGISAKRFKRLNRTDAPCNTESYVNQCEKKCIEDFLKTQIQCRLPYMSFDEIPLCDNITSASFTHLEAFKIATSFLYSNNCVCPKICDHSLIMTNLESSVPHEYSVLEMFFDDNVIDTIEEYYSYSFITLLCDLGGNLGLFLGLCIPTLLSILQSVISLIVKKIYY